MIEKNGGKIDEKLCAEIQTALGFVTDSLKPLFNLLGFPSKIVGKTRDCKKIQDIFPALSAAVTNVNNAFDAIGKYCWCVRASQRTVALDAPIYFTWKRNDLIIK